MIMICLKRLLHLDITLEDLVRWLFMLLRASVIHPVSIYMYKLKPTINSYAVTYK